MELSGPSRPTVGRSFWYTIALFLALIVFVNPLRETALQDDWSYSLMTKHLLDTGEYKLHDWAWANMPFQIYWGGLFAKIGGYSFSALRLSTLVLCLFGCVTFFLLCRRRSLPSQYSTFLLLVLISSPLFFQFSFTFMTDIPFLACIVAAFLCYSLALESQNYKWMLIGSLAAAAATLTRQVGVALIPALALLWFFGPDRRKRLPFFLLGVAAPLAAGLWQVMYAHYHPNWCWRVRSNEQLAYWKSPNVLKIMFWRVTLILHYLALYCLPFVFLGVWVFLRHLFSANRSTRRQKIIVLTILLLIAAGLLIGKQIKGLWLMPYLPWNLEFLRDSPYARLSTLVSTVGAVIFGSILVRRYTDSPGWRNLTEAEKLVDLVTLFLLIQHLLFFAFGDEYILVFLPYTILALGRYFQEKWKPFSDLLFASCLLILFGTALWTRMILAREEVYWQGAEAALHAGASPYEVLGYGGWNAYYEFENFVRDSKNQDIRNLNEFFLRWDVRRRKDAQYFFIATLERPIGRWTTIADFEYRNINLRKVRVFVVKRPGFKPE